MLKIRVAPTAGFCFGVRRAINLAENTVRGQEKIFTLGPLIHNPQEINRLAGKGIIPVDKPWRLRNKTLILRTHGIPAPFRPRLEKQKMHIVDATCPFVKRAQNIVEKLGKQQYQVLIVGEKSHPEVVGLVSYSAGNCNVVEKSSDLSKIELKKKICILSQTTQTPENFGNIIKSLKKLRPHAKVFKTICRATIDRQAEAKKLARSVDAMLVLGGKNSANTARLAQICGCYTKTYAIETADEVRGAWFKGIKSVGITAGASTPEWIIETVKKKIESIAG